MARLMKLSVPTPPGWSRHQVADGELLRAPDRPLELLVLPLEGARLAPAAWMYSALLDWRREPTAEPTDLTNGQLETAIGWRALTVEARVGTVSRFVAYFSFLDLAATVIATCANAGVAEWRAEVIEVLYRATPEFSSERIAGVRELLGGPPPTTRTARPAWSADAWRRTFSGGDAVLVLRDDPDSGWIQCAAGHTPPRTAHQLFGGFDAPPELGITDEGEYFAIAAARRDQTQRALAIVFGAESYTRIDALTTVPARFETFLTSVRALASETVLGSGTGRLRPFYYEAPAGWSALPRPGSTVWVSPTCARRYQVLRVFDACSPDRAESVRRRRFESLATEFLANPARGPAVYYRTDELEVRVCAYTGTVAGSELQVLDGAVIDASSCYPLRIECDPALLEESMQLFERVARTIVPLPSPGVEQAVTPNDATEAFANWSE